MRTLAKFNTLRFKACLFSLLLVGAMCLFFILLGNGSLQSLLEKNRESRYQSFQYHIDDLLEHSRLEAMQLAEMIALDERGHIAGRFELHQVINRQWELWQHSWGLHSLRIYGDDDGDGRGQDSNGPLTWGASGRGLSRAEVSLVLMRGQPLEQLRCDLECVQSVAVPMRSHTGDYVMQVDRLLSRPLQRFRGMTGSDIGIVASVDDPAGSGEYLPGWERKLLALTSHSQLLPLLQQVSQRVEFPRLQRSRSYNHNAREYAINSMPLEVGGGEADLIFIDDVTAQVEHINQSLRLFLLFSVLGALIFSAAVAGIAWRPIKRLRRLSEALPLLTNGRFTEARNLIRPVYKTSGTFDELDVLDNTGLTVCDQLEEMNDIVTRKTAQLEQIATHDSLTGLDNRYSLMEQLNRYLMHWRGQAPAERERGHLFFIDLDDFKQVNDTLGHQGGDELLSVIARRLSSAMRAGDVVARLGGDEFCVFVRHLSEPEAYRTLAEKMLETVAQPVKIADCLVEVTISVGVVAIGEREDTLAAILQKADTAMYHAKRHGKNKYQLYSDTLPALASGKVGVSAPVSLELVTSHPR